MSNDEASTKPTIETVLERIEGLRADVNERIEGLRTDMNRRFEDLNIRLDRIEGVTYSTRGEFVEMRLDFREFRAQFK